MHPFQNVTQHFAGFRPEWCISTMIESRDTPFWSETLDSLCSCHCRGCSHNSSIALYMLQPLPEQKESSIQIYLLFSEHFPSCLSCLENMTAMRTDCLLVNGETWWRDLVCRLERNMAELVGHRLAIVGVPNRLLSRVKPRLQVTCWSMWRCDGEILFAVRRCTIGKLERNVAEQVGHRLTIVGASDRLCQYYGNVHTLQQKSIGQGLTTDAVH